MARYRSELYPRARGRALDIGASLLTILPAPDLDRLETIEPAQLLGFAGVRDPLLPPSVPSAPASGPGGVFDSILGVAALCHQPDLPLALDAILRLLAPGGELLLVEPTRGRSLTVDTLGPLLAPRRATAGLHLQRDLPVALRDAGLLPTEILRFTVPTAVLPLRPWVRIAARREQELRA